MARWLIWSQVGFALIGAVGNLVVQRKLPHYLSPPHFLLTACCLSMGFMPSAVLFIGWRRKPGTGQFIEAVASIGLALVTFLALLPAVQ